MSEDESTVAVNVGNIHVDKAVVTNPRPDRQQTLLQLTPLLSVLITGIALVTTSAIQIAQTYLAAKQKTVEQSQKIDEDWRSSLDKITDDKNAFVGTLAMETFLGSPRYRERAGVIMATKLPNIADKDQFDVEFAEVVMQTDIGHRGAPLTVARGITTNLRDQYERIVQTIPKNQRAGKTFAAFILDPEGFGSDDTGLKYMTNKDLEYIMSESWKLDSTIRGLQYVWTLNGHPSEDSLGHGDLSGIEFYGAGKPIDFSTVNFNGITLGNSEFIGNCIVTDPKLQTINHCTH